MDRPAAADPKLARRALADWYTRAGLGWVRGRLQPWAANGRERAPRRGAGRGASLGHPPTGPDSWRLLRRAMPECARWEVELDEMGRRVWMGDLAQQ
ncbi:hypothetical protein [Streptomyces cuspidosporus]|uniref:Uncharacterized protein n=1 Tax=Streptomyces cuspidosporus TaxID=66882 RepID=A0ABN3GX38_9ACTN